MAEDNRTTQSMIGKERVVQAVDNLYPSPQDRANSIWRIIRTDPSLSNMTDWDLLCFCVEYIAMQSQQFLFIEKEAKHLSNLLYTAHYFDRTTDNDKSSHISDDSRSRWRQSGTKFGDTNTGSVSQRKSEILGDLTIEKGNDVG